MTDCDGVLVSFPCFCVGSRNGTGVVVERVLSGVFAVVVLTDADLLDRYLAENGLVGHPVLTIASAEELVGLLDRLPPEVRFVTFDPGHGVNRYWPVSDARDSLAR